MKLVSLFFVLTACGGSKPATTAPTVKTEDHADHKTEDHADHKMSPALTKFHDVLSPRWHAEKNTKRMTDTCTAMADFQGRATEVASKDLSDAVTALEAVCKANDSAAFEPAFDKLHTTFHKVMEASGGGHEHGAEHHEHGHGG